MKTTWWTAVITAGLTAGYATSVTQLSPGPGYIFSAIRNKITKKAENENNELLSSFGSLAYCGWCLSPYMTLATWTAAAKASHIRFSLKWFAGWMASTAIAAYYRHQAESLN